MLYIQMDCSVCLEPVARAAKQATCPYCATVACYKCAQQMTLMWASQPKCANCNKAFTADFIDSTFNKSFRRGPLRIAFIQNLQEQETSLLPQTMDILNRQEREKKAHGLHTKMLNSLEGLRSNPLAELGPIFDRIRGFQDELRELSDVIPSAEGPAAKKARVVHERTIKCPKEGCLGYSKRGQACALCETVVCKDCNASVANPEALKSHECNPDDRASWALIKEDSKPCPKCGTPIQKVSGCNQMWCTVSGCNTAFDWATGHVINGRIHNPHYHEWLARSGGATAAAGGGPGAAGGPDLECAGPRDILGNAVATRIYNTLKGLPTRPPHADAMANLRLQHQTGEWVRTLVESADDRVMRLRDAIGAYAGGAAARLVGPYGPDDHEDLRMEYLRGHLSKKDWATKLSTRETLRTKRERITRLHRMFQSAASDLVQKLVHDLEEAATASGTTAKVQTFTGYDRDYRGVYSTVKFPVIDSGAVATAILEPFFEACESLRVYYMREKAKLLSDYTDKKAFVLWRTASADGKSYSLVWTDVLMGSIDIALSNSTLFPR